MEDNVGVQLIIQLSQNFATASALDAVKSHSHVRLFAHQGLQHTRAISPLSPRVYSNSCPLSCLCYLTISFSVDPFFASHLSQHRGLFWQVGSLHQVAKVLELQHLSFQGIFRIDFLWDWLVWSPCSPRDS